ncbi:hypothetical protein ACCO45_010695 [Purpureocillium lilacinum]|uniref:Uncharacterized protein n=1 Tax=Purpureocillium lilacinum TaxID=33203 RepID=A0ACC4DFI4_PURLI
MPAILLATRGSSWVMSRRLSIGRGSGLGRRGLPPGASGWALPRPKGTGCQGLNGATNPLGGTRYEGRRPVAPKFAQRRAPTAVLRMAQPVIGWKRPFQRASDSGQPGVPSACQPASPTTTLARVDFCPSSAHDHPPGATAIGGTVFTALNLVGRRAKIQVKTDPGCHDCAPISDESEFTPPARASKRNLARPASTASSEPPAVRSHTCSCSRALSPADLRVYRLAVTDAWCNRIAPAKDVAQLHACCPASQLNSSAGHRSSVVPPRPAAA